MKTFLYFLLFVLSGATYAQLSISQPDNIIIYENPFDGFATFDLTQNETQTLNGIDPATVSITYYNTQQDADAAAFPIVNPLAYSNFGNPETVYVRVELASDANIFSTTNFNIEVSDDVVNIPDPNFLQSIISQGVDTNNSGNIQSFEATAVSSLHVDELVTNVTGLQAFTNLVELTSSILVYASFDLSLLPLLETLDIVIPLNGFQTPLDLSNNPNLKTLKLWNTGVSDLDVSNNVLLEELELWNTTLTTLDLNNNPNLQSLSFTSNQFLENVFIKNGADESANMDPGLWMNNWLPNSNPSLQYVCADNFQVNDIKQWAGTSYAVNSFCSTEPGGNFNNIIGTTHFDLNNDGCDSSDPIMPNLMIEVGSGPSTVVPNVSTDEMGVYNFYVVQPGDYTLQPALENPSYFNISPNFPTVNISAIDGSTTTQDFCISANGSTADAEVIIASITNANPGFDATYKLVFKNKGNQELSGDVSFNYDEAILDFVASSVSPDVQNAGSLIYNFSNLEPFESRAINISLNVNGPTETPPVNIDDVLDFNATISIDQTEETPNDNSFDFSETVVGSFDPNDITCLQGDIVPETYIGEFLHYLIRFENTGTAPAQNVVVTTEINAEDYNINTLQILDTSHDMFIRNNNGVIEFVFENIMLDSNGGQGDVLFKLKTKSNLSLSDEVNAQADIYFDFNFPIETNIANTSFENLSVSQFETENQIIIYPNPSQNLIHIKAQSAIKSISIYHLQGRAVFSQNHIESKLTSSIDISQLTPGVYLVTVNSDDGQWVQKVVRE